MQWILGPPTKPGLYVIEWMNLGGLAPYIVFQRGLDETLYFFDVKYDHPRERLVELRKWSIRRHIELPRPARHDEINYPATYEDAGDDGFNVHVGEWGRTGAEHQQSLDMIYEVFGAIGKEKASHSPT